MLFGKSTAIRKEGGLFAEDCSVGWCLRAALEAWMLSGSARRWLCQGSTAGCPPGGCVVALLRHWGSPHNRTKLEFLVRGVVFSLSKLLPSEQPRLLPALGRGHSGWLWLPGEVGLLLWEGG